MKKESEKECTCTYIHINDMYIWGLYIYIYMYNWIISVYAWSTISQLYFKKILKAAMPKWNTTKFQLLSSLTTRLLALFSPVMLTANLRSPVSHMWPLMGTQALGRQRVFCSRLHQVLRRATWLVLRANLVHEWTAPCGPSGLTAKVSSLERLPRPPDLRPLLLLSSTSSRFILFSALSTI